MNQTLVSNDIFTFDALFQMSQFPLSEIQSTKSNSHSSSSSGCVKKFTLLADCEIKTEMYINQSNTNLHELFACLDPEIISK